MLELHLFQMLADPIGVRTDGGNGCPKLFLCYTEFSSPVAHFMVLAEIDSDTV